MRLMNVQRAQRIALSFFAVSIAGCGQEQSDLDDRVAREAGPLLQQRGVHWYVFDSAPDLLAVDLHDENRERIGTIRAALFDGAPERVDVVFRGESTTIFTAPGGVSVEVEDVPTIFTFVDGAWVSASGAPAAGSIERAIVLADTLSAEILSGEPVALPSEEVQYSGTVTESCLYYGAPNCSTVSACARGRALQACGWSGGYIQSEACSCSWWRSYCIATAYCY